MRVTGRHDRFAVFPAERHNGAVDRDQALPVRHVPAVDQKLIVDQRLYLQIIIKFIYYFTMIIALYKKDWK
jgi:hypothetical protein